MKIIYNIYSNTFQGQPQNLENVSESMPAEPSHDIADVRQLGQL